MQMSTLRQLFLLLVCVHLPFFLGASNTGILLISKLTENSVEGEYRESATSERGIRFVSGPDALAITTLDGVPLLIAGEPLAEGALRMVNIAGNTFVQHSNEARESHTVDYAVPDSWENAIKGARNKYMRSLKEMDMETHTQKTLENAIQNLLLQSEVDFIKPAAFALGAQGITGKEFPGILPFYLAALQLEKIANEYFVRRNESLSHQEQVNKTPQDDNCLDECPPCPDAECLGLCGFGCSCWKFICGDCCYHLGCYEHDLCCRKKFIQTRCLFPFGFSCESEYDC